MLVGSQKGNNVLVRTKLAGVEYELYLVIERNGVVRVGCSPKSQGKELPTKNVSSYLIIRRAGHFDSIKKALRSMRDDVHFSWSKIVLFDKRLPLNLLAV